MIIQIRGTSGSGKTTVMREVMESLTGKEPIYVEGRRQPLYYTFNEVVVLGHYESPCGGCDNLPGCSYAMELAEKLENNRIVLMEGRLLSDDFKHTATVFGHGVSVKCLVLATAPEICIDRILSRRKASGKNKPFSPPPCNSMDALVKRVSSARRRLEAAGVYCRGASSSQAARIILKWIKNVGK